MQEQKIAINIGNNNTKQYSLAESDIQLNNGCPIVDTVQKFETFCNYMLQLAPESFRNEKLQKEEQTNLVRMAISTILSFKMNPFICLKNMYVVNKQLQIWGDLAVAIARGTRQLEYEKKSFTGSFSYGPIETETKKDSKGLKGDLSCTYTLKRKDNQEPYEWTVSIEDIPAEKRMTGIWKQYPKRMLFCRARAFVLRDAFPEAFTGLHIEGEDLDDVNFDEEKQKKTLPHQEELEDFNSNLKNVTNINEEEIVNG